MLRFVGELKKAACKVLDEGPSNKVSPLSKLGKVWGSGVIKDKILEKPDHYWSKLAQQGRSLEETAH